mgnify:CR=1 FL=1
MKLLRLHVEDAHGACAGPAARLFDDLVRELRSSEPLVGDVVALLEQLGAVVRQADEAYRYRASTPEVGTQ